MLRVCWENGLNVQQEITWNFTGLAISFCFQAWFCNEWILILKRGDVTTAVQGVQDMISFPHDNQQQLNNCRLCYKSEIQSKWHLLLLKLACDKLWNESIECLKVLLPLWRIAVIQKLSWNRVWVFEIVLDRNYLFKQNKTPHVTLCALFPLIISYGRQVHSLLETSDCLQWDESFENDLM